MIDLIERSIYRFNNLIKDLNYLRRYKEIMVEKGIYPEDEEEESYYD